MIALETVCYVAGAGAFCVFIRWLQTMLAYNEAKLVDSSVFNILVPAIIIASGLLFNGFIKKFKKERYFLSEDFFVTFKNESKIYSVLRSIIGAVMVVGSVMLLMECEVDREAKFLRILAIGGVITGICFTVLLASANKPHVTNRTTICFLSTVPVAFYCFWLITCYKINAINPVLWDYGMEIVALIVCILSFFNLAGFPYEVQKPWKAMFLAMLACALCLMMVADERYMGMEFMYIGGAAMQLYLVWVMICNMGQNEKEYKVQPEDNFERQ